MAVQVDLIRGQRTSVPEAFEGLSLTVAVELPGDVCAYALLLDERDGLVDGDQILFELGTASPCGGLMVRAPGVFVLTLARLPTAVARVVFAVGVSESARAAGLSLGTVGPTCLTVVADAEARFRFRPDAADLGRETALSLVEFYRKGGWRITATAAGFVGGVPSLVARHRGDLAKVLGAPSARSQVPRAAPESRGGSGPALLPQRWSKRVEPAVPACLIPAVGLVIVERREGPAAGTGFFIGPGGYFITCAHVVRDQTSAAIRLDDVLRPATLIDVDEDGDIALLHLQDRHGVVDWLLLAPADSSPALGDSLGLLGYPLGGDLGVSLTYSQGVVNSLRRVRDIPVLQVDTGAAPGSSGGPVFRRSDGRVVGVLTSGLAKQQAGILVNFAVDIRRLWRLGWVR